MTLIICHELCDVLFFLFSMCVLLWLVIMADEPMGSGSTPTFKSGDRAWAHGQVVPGKKNNTIYVYCQKHLAGVELLD